MSCDLLPFENAACAGLNVAVLEVSTNIIHYSFYCIVLNSAFLMAFVWDFSLFSREVDLIWGWIDRQKNSCLDRIYNSKGKDFSPIANLSPPFTMSDLRVPKIIFIWPSYRYCILITNYCNSLKNNFSDA